MPPKRLRTVTEWKLHESRVKFRQAFLKFRYMMAHSVSILGLSRTAKIFGVSKQLASYWVKKLNDPTFHPNTHGGARNWKYGEDGDRVVQSILWEIFNENPDYNVGHYTTMMRELGVPDIKADFVARIFRSWGWTWKLPTRTQLLKYTEENISYYAEWTQLIKDTRWERLKFLDESHFMDRDLFSRRIVGPRNERSHQIRTGRLDDSYSLTLLIDLTNSINPFHCTIRHNSNTEWDFYNCVFSACEAGYLKDGDLLVVDNASVHGGSDSYDSLLEALNDHGVKLIFLPKYSPELNPCELVFGYIKTYIRNNRGKDLHKLMMEALINLPYHKLLNYYFKSAA